MALLSAWSRGAGKYGFTCCMVKSRQKVWLYLMCAQDVAPSMGLLAEWLKGLTILGPSSLERYVDTWSALLRLEWAILRCA